MTSWALWLVLAAVLLFAELFARSTFLMLPALAMGSAGLGALAGMPVILQFAIAAFVGIGGTIWTRRAKRDREKRVRLGR